MASMKKMIFNKAVYPTSKITNTSKKSSIKTKVVLAGKATNPNSNRKLINLLNELIGDMGGDFSQFSLDGILANTMALGPSYYQTSATQKAGTIDLTSGGVTTTLTAITGRGNTMGTANSNHDVMHENFAKHRGQSVGDIP
jgi:hypothetical protein